MAQSNNNVVKSDFEGWTREQIETIRRTVAVDANPSEMSMFLHLAAKYDLDPLAREIWFIKSKNRNTVMTSRDGYLKIAHSSKQFAGIWSDVVYQNDKFSRNEAEVRHVYNAANRGNIVGAYAIVYRKDWLHPVFFFAPMRDYNKKTGCWLQYPHAMILKVAEAMALKRAFSISGLVTTEEVNTSDEIITLNVQTDQEKTILSLASPATRKNNIWRGFCELFRGDNEIAEYQIKRLVGQRPSSEWNDTDMRVLEDYIKNQQENDQHFNDVDFMEADNADLQSAEAGQ